MPELRDIEEARQRIRDRVYLSPCARSETMSRRCGAVTFFKLENLQMTGSFKERGALNKILQLDPDARRRGVIAASAGNHAQAVAYHAAQAGIPATIVMPRRTPLVKVANTRQHGAEVILHGNDFDEAYAYSLEIEHERGLVAIHPFDDEDVIAGQGTIALELLEQVPDLQMVLVPIGGGGLISGIAVAIKALRPRVKVIGVEAAACPAMKRSLEEGKRVTVGSGTTIADGIAVKKPGALTLEYVKRFVDDVVTVDEEEIANAVLVLLEQEKTVTEGAGAVTLAALYNRHVRAARGKRVVMILSGGNIDVNILSRIIERGLAKDGRLVRLEVQLPDEPGSLAALLAEVGLQSANVIEVHHERTFSDLGLARVRVELTLETRGGDHARQLEAALRERGFEATPIWPQASRTAASRRSRAAARGSRRPGKPA
ncbi:MAG TPA: threonine ammonia-lyase [Thermoanaerobaculia bacterium]|nr:threonine ammonia-lyase [Thermoanaerobaculia bacterium]